MNTPTSRIISMDQFRGYTIVGMMLVNFLGDFTLAHPVLKHHNTYCSYADTIMPSFHFCVGFAMRLSILNLLASKSVAATYGRFIRRNLALILIALVFFHIGAPLPWNQLTEQGVWGFLAGPLKSGFWNTLSIIGVTSLFVLPIMAASARMRILFLLAMAVGHVVMSYFFYFDFMFARPNVLDQWWGAANVKGLDGGPFGFVGWSILQIAGSLAYDLVAHRGKWSAAALMLFLGILFGGIGYSLSCFTTLYNVASGVPGIEKPAGEIADSPVLPPYQNWQDKDWQAKLAELPFVQPPPPSERQWNYWMMCKRVTSMSFVFFNVGFAFAAYAMFVLLCDGTPIRLGIFRTFGMNPLAAYIIHLAVDNAVKRFAPNDSPWPWIAFTFILFFLVTYVLVRGLEKANIYIRM